MKPSLRHFAAQRNRSRAARPSAAGDERAAVNARLVASNWLRTAAWTLRGVLLVWGTVSRPATVGG